MQSFSKQMLMMDGANHLRLRRQANPAFSPQALDAWRPAIRRITEELVSAVLPRGRMDLAKETAYHLPSLIIAEVLGVPPESRSRFQKWGEDIARFAIGVAGMDIVQVAKEANQAVLEFNAFLESLIEDRRRNPGNDMLSQMIHIQEGGGMAMEELMSNALLILTAGHVTTSDQINSGIYDLLTHPDQLQLLREDPSLIKPALEEMLRFSPPTSFGIRVATETFELRGRTIRKGDVVMLGLAAANRDPNVFPDPDRFDIRRDHTHQKHLSFAFGAHHCLGAGLARRELEIAFEILLAKMPNLRLDEELQPQRKPPSILFRNFDSMPVRW
jgi:cytochrome P450 PksS